MVINLMFFPSFSPNDATDGSSYAAPGRHRLADFFFKTISGAGRVEGFWWVWTTSGSVAEEGVGFGRLCGYFMPSMVPCVPLQGGTGELSHQGSMLEGLVSWEGAADRKVRYTAA